MLVGGGNLKNEVMGLAISSNGVQWNELRTVVQSSDDVGKLEGR